MQTLAEYEARIEADRRQRMEEHLRSMREWMAVLERRNLPPCSVMGLATEEIWRARRDIRERTAQGETRRRGVGCDHCGTELVDMVPGTQFLDPPQIPLGCPGCGWRGFTKYR